MGQKQKKKKEAEERQQLLEKHEKRKKILQKLKDMLDTLKEVKTDNMMNDMRRTDKKEKEIQKAIANINQLRRDAVLKLYNLVKQNDYDGGPKYGYTNGAKKLTFLLHDILKPDGDLENKICGMKRKGKVYLTVDDAILQFPTKEEEKYNDND